MIIMGFMDDIKNLTVCGGELAISWLGQNSYIFKTPRGTLIAVDPYLSRIPPEGVEVEEYFVHPEPPVKPEDFRVDYVFCTHDHSDHTDPITLSAIAKHSPRTIFFGTPESYRHFLRAGIPKDRARSLRDGETIEVGDFKVSALSSIIGCERDGRGRKWTTHYGYIFDFGFVKVYNMGDSSPEVVADPTTVLGRVANFSPEIAILPIIGDFPGRRPEDAVKFAKIIKPKIVIPSHYGCFKRRTIDPKVFAELLEGTPDIKPVIIDYMGVYIYRETQPIRQ